MWIWFLGKMLANNVHFTKFAKVFPQPLFCTIQYLNNMISYIYLPTVAILKYFTILILDAVCSLNMSINDNNANYVPNIY